MADRGDHPGSCDRLACAGCACGDPLLAWRRARTSGGARPGRRAACARAGRRDPQGGEDTAAGGVLLRRARGIEPHDVPRRPGRGHPRGAERHHDRDRALPGRDRRLASRGAKSLRRPGARPVGDGDPVPLPREDRPRGARNLDRRWHRTAPARLRRPAEHEAHRGGPGRSGGPCRRRARNDRALRRPLPRERRQSPPHPAAAPRSAHTSVAAAPALIGPPSGGPPVRDLPDHPRDLPRVPERLVRPAGRPRSAAAHPLPRGRPRRGRDRERLTLRRVAAVRVHRDLHVRRRYPGGRAAGRGARPRPGLPERAARARRSCATSSTRRRWRASRHRCRRPTPTGGPGPRIPCTTFCGVWAT